MGCIKTIHLMMVGLQNDSVSDTWTMYILFIVCFEACALRLCSHYTGEVFVPAGKAVQYNSNRFGANGSHWNLFAQLFTRGSTFKTGAVRDWSRALCSVAPASSVFITLPLKNKYKKKGGGEKRSFLKRGFLRSIMARFQAIQNCSLL